MENKQLIKGNYLEVAVEKIQRLIIQTNPSLKTSKFTIERKKLIFPGGVRREIDLYVEVDPGNDLESIFIFECKNWEKPVDANSITIFDIKIKETNATKGFFVAKKFSKDAEKEAKKYPRITLLTANNNYIDTSPFPEIHMTYDDKSKRRIDLEVVAKGATKRKSKIQKFKFEEVFLGNKDISAQDFLMELCEIVIDEKMRNEPTESFSERIYPYSHKKEFTYEPGKLKINKLDIEKIILKVDFEIQIIKPLIVSNFDIKSKGRYLQQEFRMPNGAKLNATFVAIK